MDGLATRHRSAVSLLFAAVDSVRFRPRASRSGETQLALDGIQQGLLPTCHLVAAARAVHKQRPDLSAQLFKQVSTGVQVRCFKPTSDSHQESQVIVPSQPKRLFGVGRGSAGSMLEEAFAATFGRAAVHQLQDPRHALSWLTGAHAQTQAIDDRREWPAILTFIGELLATGESVVLHGRTHAMAVMDVNRQQQTVQIQCSQRTLRVRNLRWLRQNIVAISYTNQRA